MDFNTLLHPLTLCLLLHYVTSQLQIIVKKRNNYERLQGFIYIYM